MKLVDQEDSPYTYSSKDKILINKAKCLMCNDIIVSRHRHDFVTCSCGSLAVDGGKEYLKRSCVNLTNYEELSIHG